MFPGTHAAVAPERPAVIMAGTGRGSTVGDIDGDPELAEELIGYVRDRLAHFKAPKSVDFVDELPRSATGKLVKRTLKDRYLEVSR